MIVKVSPSYMSSFSGLSKSIQKKAEESIRRLRDNSTASGRHKETLRNAPPNVRSVRIDDKYRLIGSEEGNTITLIYCGNHDDVYKWINGRNIDELVKDAYEFSNDPEWEKNTSPQRDFLGMLYSYSNRQLFELGFTIFEITCIQNAADEDSFNMYKAGLSREKDIMLDLCIEGESFDDILDVAQSVNKAEIEIKENAPTQNGCMIIDSEYALDEFVRAANGEIDKWRLFLHPAQERYAFGNFDGAVFISGAAGTGKTVVALHRAARLAKLLGDNERILFTTYTKNLTENIRTLLSDMCGELSRKIHVVNIDLLINELFRESFNSSIIYRDEVCEQFGRLLAEEQEDNGLCADFFVKEWERVIIPNNITTKEQYRTVSREGMGYPMNRARRDAAWRIFSKYYERCRQSKTIDIDLACRMIMDKLLADGKTVYKHIIVDEVQDFSVNKLRVISALSGSPHCDNIFMVGDRMQNIFGGAPSFERCGIDTTGREFKLVLNYRTTGEIGNYAAGLLGSESNVGTGISLMHDKSPETLYAERGDYSILLPYVDSINTNVETVCIVSQTNKERDNIFSFLTEKGYDVTVLDRRNSVTKSGISVAAIQRVKGLEFDNVIIWGMERWIAENNRRSFSSDLASSNEIEQSKRHLAYVAATRARKRVWSVVTDKKG